MGIRSVVVIIVVHLEAHALRDRNHIMITATTLSNAHRGVARITNVKNISTNALLNAGPTGTALIQDHAVQMDTVAQLTYANRD
jgi:hypothetical protein